MNNKKMLKLEVHKYAPELNKVHFKNGVKIDAKKATSINEFRKSYSKKRVGKYVTITFLHDGSNKRFNKSYSGFINNYKEILTFKKDRLKKHNLCTNVKISIRYIQS